MTTAVIASLDHDGRLGTARGGHELMNAMPDPLDEYVQRALDADWAFVPQVTGGFTENALIRTDGHIWDVVTLPAFGRSTVVRLRGGLTSPWPRHPGVEQFRHLVDPEMAMAWALGGHPDDFPLIDWQQRYGWGRS